LARCYGMARVTRMWKVSRASVYRSLKETPPNTIARRRGPVTTAGNINSAGCLKTGPQYRTNCHVPWRRVRKSGMTPSPVGRFVIRFVIRFQPHGAPQTETIRQESNAGCPLTNCNSWYFQFLCLLLETLRSTIRQLKLARPKGVNAAGERASAVIAAASTISSRESRLRSPIAKLVKKYTKLHKFFSWRNGCGGTARFAVQTRSTLHHS
jgi:hypothetical protein